MATLTSEHVHQGLLSSHEIEELVSQLVSEEISIHQQNQKLKIAQERAMEQARRDREAQIAAFQSLSSAGRVQGDTLNGLAFMDDEAGLQNAYGSQGKRAWGAAVADDAYAYGSTTPGFDDMEALADEYVADKTFKERIRAIARGVHDVLAERLSPNAEDFMSDMPVIQRADGSVGDIGESWWKDATTREANAGFSAEQKMENAADANAALEAEMRSAAIAKRVHHMEEAPFDLNQSIAVSREGSWDEALAAMEQNAQENLALTMGDIMSAAKMEATPTIEEMEDAEFDWIDMDEVDGIEPDTGFLTFRVPGGHPEVQDTASYVDYLVKDELLDASSPLIKKHAQKRNATHLRVIEGGSGRIRKAM